MPSIKNDFPGIVRKLLSLTLIIFAASPIYPQEKTDNLTPIKIAAIEKTSIPVSNQEDGSIIKVKFQNSKINPCPEVIPGIREWKGLSGSYDVKSRKEIRIDPDYFNLLEITGQCFIDDLSSLGIMDFQITKSKNGKGAISISLDCTDDSLGNEGYMIEIDKGISIVANTPKGVFMGSRTVLQLINLYGNNIPKGLIRDYPKYKRRGFMLDTGRKFFKLDFLENYVKILSYYKMNEFHIHLNDNGFKQFFENDWSKTYSAFRLESETYPGLTATDGSYSKEEFRELQKLGQRYGVNIIPEIDAPAHSLAFTKYLPEIGSQKYGMDHLDISKKETYNFLDGLYEEYLGGDDPVFIGTDVHIGTDEYSKDEAEAFRAFTDYYIKKVQSYGKRARVWGALTHAEGSTPVSSDNVIMNAWYNGYADPAEMIKQGYELITTSDRHLYIVPAAGYYYDYLNLEFLLEKWEPNIIGGDTFPMGHPQISGGMFAVWNDHCGNGISEKDVHHRVFPALQTLAQKMWYGGDKDLSLQEFTDRSSALLEAPGINLMGIIPHEGDTVLHYDFKSSKDKDQSVNSYDLVNCKTSMWENNEGLRFDAENHIVLPVEEIGYPYIVSLEITVKQLNSESILFSSSNAELVLNPKDNKIEIGFKRDGYFYSFSNLLDKNKKLKLAISGDSKGTSLFINGKEVERLEGNVEEYYKEDGKVSKMFIQQTLVFPLREIGGFEGILHELTVTSKKGSRAHDLKILTFNIFHGEAYYKDNQQYQSNLIIVADLINELNPDMVALQEVDRKTGRSKGVNLVLELAKLTNMTPLFGKTMDFDGGEYGLGILSDYSFLSTRILPLSSDKDSEPRAALESIVILETGDTVRFVSTHFDHRNANTRDQQARDINSLFCADNIPSIIAGDFNARPDSKTIEIIKEKWINSSPNNEPTSPSIDPKGKIDYIFYHPSKNWKLIESKVIEEKKASDHNPVFSVLRLIK